MQCLPATRTISAIGENENGTPPKKEKNKQTNNAALNLLGHHWICQGMLFSHCHCTDDSRVSGYGILDSAESSHSRQLPTRWTRAQTVIHWTANPEYHTLSTRTIYLSDFEGHRWGYMLKVRTSDSLASNWPRSAFRGLCWSALRGDSSPPHSPAETAAQHGHVILHGCPASISIC